MAQNVPIRNIPGAEGTPNASSLVAMDDGITMSKTTVQKVVDAGAPVASQGEAETGSDNSKRMTPLRVKQSIASEVTVSVASASQGVLASTAVQPEDLGDLATKDTVNNDDWSGANLALANGGTGASTADAARTNLGLGTAATTDAAAYATAAQGEAADTALQPGGVDVPDDLNATGTPSATTVLFGDGSWKTLTGGGDLISANNLSDLDNVDTALDNLGAGASGKDVFRSSTPAAARMATNVRGKINFFDFLQETRSAAVREQIMNGTFTGDLAVEWQAFRDALWAIYDDGGRPYGFIPECKIYSSVAPNFAMDYLTLETQGSVRIEAIGSVSGFSIDGMGLGQGQFGVRSMKVGRLCASTADGGRGVYIRRAHMSQFDGLISLGGVFAGVQVDGCVTSNFDNVLVTAQAEPFIKRPSVGLYVSGTDGGPIIDPEDPTEAWKNLLQTSWCKFDLPVLEYVPTGIQFDHTFGNMLLGGTAEACSDTGIIFNENAWYNKIYGLDLEQNSVWDMQCWGRFNDFFGVDSLDPISFALGAVGNKVFGGHFGQITFDADTKRNLISGANVTSLTDNSTGADRNRIRDITDNSGNWTDRWISSAPTVAASVGTIGTSSSVLSHRVRDGDTVDFQLQITVTTNGGGSGELRLLLPISPAMGCGFGGQEIGVTGKGVSASMFAGNPELRIRFADGTYPGANGALIVVSGTYRRA